MTRPPRGSGRGWLLPALPALFLLVVIPFDLCPWLRGPAPYPPEWQWYLRATPFSGPRLPVLMAVAALVSVVALSDARWASRSERKAATLLLAAAMFLGWGFQISLVALDPDGPWRTLLARAASRTITSYHAVAISEDARDPRAFLAHYASLLEGYRTSAKHAATHPPGPVLYYRAALAVCEEWPPLVDSLLGAAGLPDRDFPPPNTRAARAAALLGALLLGLLGAATVWPIAGLAQTMGLAPLPAARVATLFVLLPGPALMTPQFDQALAFPVTAAIALLASAIGTERKILPTALLAGLFAALAVFTSYGAAVFLAIGGLAALSLAKDVRSACRRGLLVLSLAAATAVALIAATALLGHDPVASARAALAIHREVYTAPRSYALWLVFNPLDLAVFIGAPIAALFLMQAWRLATRAPPRRPSPAERFAIVTAAGLALLVLSGLTRGEVGRLWIPLMPLLLVAALLRTKEREDGSVESPTTRDSAGLAALLAALSCLIAGFWQL